MKKVITVLSIVMIVITLLLTFFLAINRLVIVGAGSITESGSDYTINKKYDAIVVLGAGLKADGTPSNMLKDRLNGAIEIYKKGVAPKIIVSGDCSGEYYDEVSAMQKYCIDNGGETAIKESAKSALRRNNILA